MDFRQLEAFRLVTETGSFSEAATHLGVSQPSISTHISALETELGGKLFIRRARHSELTKRGELLYPYAVDMLNLREKALKVCGNHTGITGTVSVAASSIPYQFVLPIMAAQFALKNAEVQFDLSSVDSARAVQLVLDDEVDMGMAGTEIQHAGLNYEAILEDELVVVTPNKAPYTEWSAAPVQIESLLDVPFVIREQGSGTRTEIESYLEQQGYENGALRVIATMDNPDALIKSVEQGLGITMLSSLAATDYERKGTIKVFKLANSPAKRKLYLVTKQGRVLSKAAAAFANFVTHRDA